MSTPSDAAPPLILLGAGGHAKVLLALAQADRRCVIGVCDPRLAQEGQKEWRGIPVLRGDDAIYDHNPAQIGLINGVGQLVGNSSRARLYLALRQRGYHFPALVHPTAWVADDVKLSDGVQIMAGVSIQPDSTIGENSIINTQASIDHDCQIAEHVHVAPGATLCGGVHVGAGAFIGAGAVVIQSLTVGANAVVGAGMTLTRCLAAGNTQIGAPSRLKTT